MVWAWLERLCCGCETLFGVDVDHLFSYTTIKYVNILDRRLGITKMILTSAILVYVLVFQIWGQGGYLTPFPVNGYARFTLQQPTVDGCDPTAKPSPDICYNDFTPVANLSYCKQSSLPYAGGKLPCKYMDNIEIETMMTSAIVVGSRITTSTQSLNCSDSAPNCPEVYTPPYEASKVYVADLDRYTLLIDHGVTAVQLGLSGESRAMDGRLYVPKNNALCATTPGATTKQWNSVQATKAPCYIAPNRTSAGLDIVYVGVLMAAADLSLDTVNYDGRTFRDTGAVVTISIEYSNFKGWLGLSKEITYVYTVNVLQLSEYKIYSTVYEQYPTNRTVINTHGLYTSALLTGYLYGQSFQDFLIHLTTSLTLLAIATTVVDMLAMYVMPDRAEYYKLKYETSEDFSELRKKREYTRLSAAEPLNAETARA